MKIKITKLLGTTSIIFEIEKQKDKDALFMAGSLASMPTKCGLCQSSNVVLAGNKAKEYTFVKIVCSDCKAKSQMGEYKDGSGFYWKDWEIYQGGGRDESIPVIEEDEAPLPEEE